VLGSTLKSMHVSLYSIYQRFTGHTLYGAAVLDGRGRVRKRPQAACASHTRKALILCANNAKAQSMGHPCLPPCRTYPVLQHWLCTHRVPDHA
jgi:hypothetical protein